ncbi:MAG: DUF2779 domain-containing protein [Salinispira sp.]
MNRLILLNDLYLGRYCLRQLDARLRKREKKIGGRALDDVPVNACADPPEGSIHTHRFLEAYRVTLAQQNDLKAKWSNRRAADDGQPLGAALAPTPQLQQLYPGRIRAFVESYSATVGEINRQSRTVLNSLLTKKEGAVLNGLLIIKGRIVFFDLIEYINGGLRLTLLKNDAKIKTNYYIDVAWAVQGLLSAGYEIRESFLRLLNKKYRNAGHAQDSAGAQGADSANSAQGADNAGGTARGGEVDSSLFIEHRVSRRHKFMRRPVENLFEEMEKSLALFSLPHCGHNSCTFCATEVLPSVDDVRSLYRSAGLHSLLKQQGIERISELTEISLPLKQKIKHQHWIQYRAVVEGREQINDGYIRKFLDSLEWPLFFLDFECFLEALPAWKSAGVWEHIPFLYSLHTMRADMQVRKVGHYLIENGVDRRRELAACLTGALPDRGSVLVYGITLERRSLAHLALAVPELSGELRALTQRLVDLQTLFADFAYYHPRQNGKIGLKTLFSLLNKQEYPQDQIASGVEAFVGYYYLMYPDIPIPWDTHADRVRNDPEKFFREVVSYCDIDSSAIAYIIQALIEKSSWTGYIR